MPAHQVHREEIVRTAAALFRQQGYAATGTNKIVEVSGAPKGSLYHYFPQGKEQIAEAAVAHAGELVRRTLTELLTSGAEPGAALREYGRLLSGWLRESEFRDGCPITTTLLELAPGSRPVSAAGRRAFDGWTGAFARALVDAGADDERARELGELAVMALEGALVLARVHQDAGPVLRATESVAGLFDAAVA